MNGTAPPGKRRIKVNEKLASDTQTSSKGNKKRLLLATTSLNDSAN
jgi:hypothetical protein